MRPRVGQAAGLQAYAQHYRESKGQARTVAAVVLHDAMGMVQEIEATRLHSLESMQNYATRVARPLTVSQSIVGLKKIIEHSTLAARTADEQARGVPDVLSETIQVGDPGFGPRIYQTFTTTREERAASDSRRVWNDLAQKYDEEARARFQSTYETVMQAFIDQVEKCDQDWASWAQEPSWEAWLDDYDGNVYSECARLVEDYAACLAGGAAGEKSVAVWKKWLEDRPDMLRNPVYRALFFNQQTLVEHLVPADDNLNKGDKLYDTVRALLDSDDFNAYVTPRLKAAVAAHQVALTGALARVTTTLDVAGVQLAAVSREVALRAQQGVILLYEGIEMTLLRVQLSFGEYQRMLSALAFDQAGEVAEEVQEFLDEAGRKVRSLVRAGLLNIDDPRIRDTVIEVLIWSFDKAEDIQQQINKILEDLRNTTGRLSGQLSEITDNAARAGSVLVGSLSGEMRSVRLGATLLSAEAAERIRDLRAGIRMSSKQLVFLGRSLSSKSIRVVGSGNVILAAGSLFFQGWALRDSLRSADETLGASGAESQLSLISPAVGIVGASAEVLGFSMNALGRQVGEKFIRAGGGIAAAASLVDAVQSGFATVRTWKHGDADAAGWHLGATILFGVGGALSGYAVMAGSAALLGPLGIALALIALGVIATWVALNAEDTQAEIWLDRCYFGRGRRAEGQWTDGQVAEELAALNAIVVGLSATLSFSDDWLGISERVSGYERIDVEIRISGFDATRAGYEWRLHARHRQRGEIAMMGGRHRVPAPAQYVSAAPRRGLSDWMKRDDPQKWTREFEGRQYYDGTTLVISKSVEVLRSRFQEARLEMDYWADYSDQSALARIELEDED
ncbi:T6SS effector BTH_I2691 family protein [Luteimonas endophytica]